MFGNKILLVNFAKLSKNKVNHKATASISFCNSKSPEKRQQKISDCAFTSVNGFANPLILSRNPAEMTKIQKYMSYTSGETCWKCKQESRIKQFACTSCGALQYPKENINFFKLLSISQTYDIDLDELSKKFKNMQKIFHPDKFANKTKEELEISESYSRLLNKAYTTLKHPLQRGIYMLELANIAIDESFDMEPDFLMLIMEKNEELECLNCPNSLVRFLNENSEDINKQIKLISEAFRVNNLNAARLSLMKLNYFTNLDKRVREKQSDLIMNPK